MQHRIGWILTTALIVGCNAQSPSDKAAGTPPASAATTANAAPTIGIDLAGIDKAVKPGDDFEEYANGAWRKKTEIPADRASIGTGFYVYELSEKRTRDLIQNAGKANPAAGTDERKIADYYAAYMDEAAIEKRGLQAIDADLKAIDAIADTKALSRALGAPGARRHRSAQRDQLRHRTSVRRVRLAAARQGRHAGALPDAGWPGHAEPRVLPLAGPAGASATPTWPTSKRSSPRPARRMRRPRRRPSSIWKPRSPTRTPTSWKAATCTRPTIPGRWPITPSARRASTGRRSSTAPA